MVGRRHEQQNNATEKQNETKLLKKPKPNQNNPKPSKVLSRYALLARRLHTDNSKLSGLCYSFYESATGRQDRKQSITCQKY